MKHIKTKKFYNKSENQIRPVMKLLQKQRRVWEKLRRGDIKGEEKKKLMKEIMEHIEGRVGDVSKI